MVRVPSAIFNAVQPQKWAKPEGLSRKMAIHCVMLLDNNPLLPSSHALCLAIFQLSAIVNETSTDPRPLSSLYVPIY
ncbi:MAG: hypothetical protein RL571_149 [Pseudomonadota bacterium]|jgi:hypothetical protein